MIKLGSYHPVPKPSKKKGGKPSMKERKKFSKETKQQAIDYWDGICANCRMNEPVDAHHIKFKSQGGRGVLSNCLPVCRACHDKIHQNVELAAKWREWAKKEYGHRYFMDEWDFNK